MPRRQFYCRTPHRQAGAALVVGLLLLLVLTVLAISGTSTSSLSLIMAGNAQYAQNAFQAAEGGIERSIAKNEFNNTVASEEQEGAVGNDSFSAVTSPELGGLPQPALPGSSTDDYSSFHFKIDSKGTSQRGATTNNLQGIGVLAKADATYTGTGALE